ncbi:hypothetical protein BGZ63DRAFT_400499 [Mariannaea sp. PMI_226]|nr:hypothetical protein BGZ63DRAFT_400499 [Mariannaea sp. PMI_226]
MEIKHIFIDTTPLFHSDTAPRMPQYNTANESASQRGQASSEPIVCNQPSLATTNSSTSTSITTAATTITTILTSSTGTGTDDTSGASNRVDLVVVVAVSPEAAARSAPSVASGAKVVSTSAASVSGAADGTTTTSSTTGGGVQLTLDNLTILNMVNKRAEPVTDRIFFLSCRQNTIPSSAAMDMEYGSISIHCASEDTQTNAGDSITPVPGEPLLTEIMGIGYWADPPRDPSGLMSWGKL